MEVGSAAETVLANCGENGLLTPKEAAAGEKPADGVLLNAAAEYARAAGDTAPMPEKLDPGENPARGEEAKPEGVRGLPAYMGLMWGSALVLCRRDVAEGSFGLGPGLARGLAGRSDSDFGPRGLALGASLTASLHDAEVSEGGGLPEPSEAVFCFFAGCKPLELLWEPGPRFLLPAAERGGAAQWEHPVGHAPNRPASTPPRDHALAPPRHRALHGRCTGVALAEAWLHSRAPLLPRSWGPWKGVWQQMGLANGLSQGGHEGRPRGLRALAAAMPP